MPIKLVPSVPQRPHTVVDSLTHTLSCLEREVVVWLRDGTGRRERTQHTVTLEKGCLIKDLRAAVAAAAQVPAASLVLVPVGKSFTMAALKDDLQVDEP